MSTTSKLIVSGIVAILIVALGTTSIIQANAQTKEEQIRKCNEIKASLEAEGEHSLINSLNKEWKDMHCGFLEEMSGNHVNVH